MRSSVGKIQLLLAAAALSAPLVSLTSCRHYPTLSKDYLDRPPEAISVIVTFDPEKKVAVTSNKWEILRGGKDSIQWTSPNGVVSVDFGKDDPFEGPPTYDEKNRILRSKPAKRVAERKVIDYKARLTLFDGGTVVEIDPRIEIWP